jgi:hypothetical protein
LSSAVLDHQRIAEERVMRALCLKVFIEYATLSARFEPHFARRVFREDGITMIQEAKHMRNTSEIKPFDNFPALGGYHCVTSSLRKIFHHYDPPLSEDMLFGAWSAREIRYTESVC